MRSNSHQHLTINDSLKISSFTVVENRTSSTCSQRQEAFADIYLYIIYIFKGGSLVVLYQSLIHIMMVPFFLTINV